MNKGYKEHRTDRCGIVGALLLLILLMSIVSLTACVNAETGTNIQNGETQTAGTDLTQETVPEPTAEPTPEPTATPTPTPTPAPKVVILDPGHGGGFTGAAYDGLVEKTLVLKIAGFVREYLEEYEGVEIWMTRETDEPMSRDVVDDLKLRADLAAEKHADIYVSLHLNGSANHNLNGATIYVSKQPWVNEECTRLGTNILNNLVELGLKSNRVRTRDSGDTVDDNGAPVDYYAVNRYCAAYNIPGIIVEHCYMDNEIDRVFLTSDEELRKLAKADADGIAAYLGLE